MRKCNIVSLVLFTLILYVSDQEKVEEIEDLLKESDLFKKEKEMLENVVHVNVTEGSIARLPHRFEGHGHGHSH